MATTSAGRPSDPQDVKLTALLAWPTETLKLQELRNTLIAAEHFAVTEGWIKSPITEKLHLPLKVWSEPLQTASDSHPADHTNQNKLFDLLFTDFALTSPNFGNRASTHKAFQGVLLFVREDGFPLDIPCTQDPVIFMLEYLERKVGEVCKVLAVARQGPKEKLAAYQKVASKQFTAEAMAREFEARREKFIKGGATRWKLVPNPFHKASSIPALQDAIRGMEAKKKYGVGEDLVIALCEAPDCGLMSAYLLPISCGLGGKTFWHCGECCRKEASKELRKNCGHAACGDIA